MTTKAIEAFPSGIITHLLGTTGLLPDSAIGPVPIANARAFVSVADFGAIGDAVRVATDQITATDPTVTGDGLTVTAADVGKRVSVPGAGTAGGCLISTIASINSANSFELADAPATTVASPAILYGTDDTAAIAAAIASASSLHVPPSGYLISRLSLNGKTDFRLSGSGTLYHDGSVGAYASIHGGADAAWIEMADCTRAVLSGLALVGNGAKNFITVVDNIDSACTDLSLSGAFSGAAMISAAGNVRHEYSGNDVDGSGATSAGRGMWIGHYNADGEIEQSPFLSSNFVHDCAASGIVLGCAHSGRAEGNRAFDNEGAGMIWAGANGRTTKNTIFLNNHAKGNAFHGFQEDAILGSESIGCAFVGNVTEANTNSGIYLKYSRGTLCVGNTCIGNSNGITVASNVHGAIIKGNTVNPGHESGIVAHSEGGDAEIIGLAVLGNTVSGTTAQSIYLVQGTGGAIDGALVQSNVVMDSGAGGSVVAFETNPGSITNSALRDNICIGSAAAVNTVTGAPAADNIVVVTS